MSWKINYYHVSVMFIYIICLSERRSYLTVSIHINLQWKYQSIWNPFCCSRYFAIIFSSSQSCQQAQDIDPIPDLEGETGDIS